MTLGLLHCFEVINIYDLMGVSNYYLTDCEDLNYNMPCNYEKTSEFKPFNNYFIPKLNLFKYKTFYDITTHSKPHIINTINDFYDMNSHIIKNNNSLIEQVNRLKPYYDSYNDLNSFIVDNNPLQH